MRIIRDEENKRVCTMWTENGVQHRLNSVPFDGLIPLHKHKHAHDASIKGNFKLTMISPKNKKSSKKVKTGDKLVVPAFWEHTFKPLPIPKKYPQVWEVDCSWPDGVCL